MNSLWEFTRKEKMNPNDKPSTIELLNPKPFRNKIVTTGTLPDAFVDSMSYYEVLAWLCNYISTEIIEKINEDTTSINDLVIEFNKLYDYVNNFLKDYDDLKQEFIDLKLYVDRQLIEIRQETEDTIDEKCLECKNWLITQLNAFRQAIEGEMNRFETEINQTLEDFEIGNVEVLNPMSGQMEPVTYVIDQLYDLFRTDALTAGEYDALDMTAQYYDGKQLTALAYDTLGKNLLP